MKLPARVSFYNTILKYKQPQKPFGHNLKMKIRTKAKKMPLYTIPIEVEPLVFGKNDAGEKIPISTIGRWLFGVPGYKGHIVVIPTEEEVEIRLALPENEDVRKIILNLVKESAKKLGLKEKK